MMGWAFCGNDDDGRPIGYGVEATCDFPGCEEVIDRGLAYVCGEMHCPTEWGCGKYFCPAHQLTHNHACPYPQPEGYEDDPSDMSDLNESLEKLQDAAPSNRKKEQP